MELRTEKYLWENKNADVAKKSIYDQFILLTMA